MGGMLKKCDRCNAIGWIDDGVKADSVKIDSDNIEGSKENGKTDRNAHR